MNRQELEGRSQEDLLLEACILSGRIEGGTVDDPVSYTQGFEDPVSHAQKLAAHAATEANADPDRLSPKAHEDVERLQGIAAVMASNDTLNVLDGYVAAKPN